MTDYGIDRLCAGLDVGFKSTGLPYGLRIVNKEIQVFTDEASMILPTKLIDEIIEVRNKFKDELE